MANPVIMPRQGQSVEACIITAWHKKVGDAVSEGDLLFSYETDKSAFDEKSPVSGTMLAILALDGDVVPCLDTVCVIGQAGEDVSAFTGAPTAEAKGADATPATPATVSSPAVTPVQPVQQEGDILRISPRAKALALQTGVDMTRVTATGPHGRIIQRDIDAALDSGYHSTVADVEAYLAGGYKGNTAVAVTQGTALEVVETQPDNTVYVAGTDFGLYEEAPMSGVRKAISRSMCASLTEMAQLTLNASFDATSVMEYRKHLKENAEILGLGKITLNDMVLYAVSRTLLKHPYINANLIGDTFRLYRHANIGLAVDTDRGLLVPTLFGADTMTLSQIAEASKDAAGRARSGQLSPDEMSGGSFTVTNLGSLGIESFTPVINPPQTAILGVCTITNRLRADGSVYPAMGLSLTFDHRAVDGAPAAKFLAELCTNLENFQLLLAK
ncbi:MAG: 2-oxo acid dehydrogenase subunit E2 [Clostridiales bacterium]|jgi:pyruvate dehydrogenase E2 component (dihydrolipoamide acetyltransferase)|nr:2-oxo acid dehydrogenase subunit E2 [Clostridiales bacterium]